jgi:protein-tyrosine-phosphatase
VLQYTSHNSREYALCYKIVKNGVQQIVQRAAAARTPKQHPLSADDSRCVSHVSAMPADQLHGACSLMCRSYRLMLHAAAAPCAAKKRGVLLTSRSRPLEPVDLSKFDYIIGMDAKNLRAIKEAGEYWQAKQMGGAGAVPVDFSSRVSLMTDFCRGQYQGAREVPDPYYGGQAGFETVLDLLEDACEGLLEHIREGRGL